MITQRHLGRPVHRGVLVVLAAGAMLGLSAFAGAATHKATARLHGSDSIGGDVRYSEDMHAGHRERHVRVRIQGALPLHRYEVEVAGRHLGEIRTNALGNGRLNLSTSGMGHDDHPLPPGFRRLHSGDFVSVGDLSGVCFEDDHNDRYELQAEYQLGARQIQAEYDEKQIAGALDRKFEVAIEHGGEIHAEIPVFVNNVQVGQIITDGSGSGKLEFRSLGYEHEGDDGLPMPDTFPSLQPGDAVRVGDVTLTLGLNQDS